METLLEKRMAQHIATLTFQHLTRSNLVREESNEPLIYVWMQPDRVVLIVNPLRIKNLDALTKPRFEHHLATVLQGRRVAVTNHRGIFVQVGYYPEPHRALATLPLDLAAQPSPVHVPIGMTASGPLWLPLVEMDAVLLGGARRMGKTNFLHTWIAALLQGKETRVILFDGKGGVEFSRYAHQAQVVEDKLAPVLSEIFAEMGQRFEVLKQAHVSNLADYNQGRAAKLERIALIVDELAFALEEAGVEDVLVDLTARGGAVGVHPVLATQRPSSDVITPRLKGNLVTRIALPVPDRASSMVVLDRAGAERIAKTPGRLLLAHSARLIEAQAFRVGDQMNGVPLAHKLMDRERRLAQAAIENDGWFRAKEIATATGETLEFVVSVAQRWEVIGWLTPVQRNEHGHKLGRRITPKLAAEFGERPNLANLAE